MAVLMVCGNVARIPGSPFDPARTLTANIALEMAYALGDHRAALFASGSALLVGCVSWRMSWAIGPVLAMPWAAAGAFWTR